MEHLIEKLELDCGDVTALLSGLIDDELPHEVRHAAERHMASCAGCRAALNAAEQNDDLFALACESSTGLTPLTLPAGFEEQVFAQTTRAIPMHYLRHRSRWFALSGWLAAAAMLTFTAIIWAMNNRPDGSLKFAGNDGNDSSAIGVPASSQYYALPPEAVSNTSDIYLTSLPATREADRDAAPAEQLGESDRGRIALGIESAQGPAVVNDRPMFFSGQTRLSREDQDTLITASNLVSMLMEFETGSMRKAEEMRLMIENSDILDRLERTCEVVPDQNVGMLKAVQSVLWNISNGPVYESDMRRFREVAASLDLVSELDRLSGNANPRHSM